MKRLALVISVAAALALTGCASTPTTAEAPAPATTASPAPSVEPSAPPAEEEAVERADVPWDDYGPIVQTLIDDLQAAADCAGLQAEFDTADANNQLTMDRVGHNADLMAYIDEALNMAGCY